MFKSAVIKIAFYALIKSVNLTIFFLFKGKVKYNLETLINHFITCFNNFINFNFFEYFNRSIRNFN